VDGARGVLILKANLTNEVSRSVALEIWEHIPVLIFVKLIAHILGEFLELPLGLGIVGVDHPALIKCLRTQIVV